MSTAYLSPKIVPSGTEFPGTVQALINLLVQYIGVAGMGGSQSINYGSTTPLEEDRDKPWFKTTAIGVPVGWFSWDGTAWKSTPVSSNVGTTANRPFSPNAGTLYFDTSINCMIVFERSKWRTLSGAPGDIKYVAKETLEEAITQNPGWIEYTNARGRVIGGAGAGSGLTERDYGEKVGEEETTLTLSQMPRFTPKVKFTMSSNYTQSGDNIEGAPGTQGGEKTLSGDPIGEGQPHSNMQPTLFLWCLIKE